MRSLHGPEVKLFHLSICLPNCFSNHLYLQIYVSVNGEKLTLEILNLFFKIVTIKYQDKNLDYLRTFSPNTREILRFTKWKSDTKQYNCRYMDKQKLLIIVYKCTLINVYHSLIIKFQCEKWREARHHACNAI